jgi:nitroimidazol reductase NimA-like FMN-containing flavoprotein (pyridoxamine 5'-phosphate oxidase superfamily)
MKRLTRSLKEFCQKQELLRLAYVDGRGRPRVVPVWFVVIGADYYVGTGAESPKRKAIKRSSRVAWAIDGGTQGKYKGLSMSGKAEVVRDAKLRARIYRAFGKKYFGSADQPKHIEIWGEVHDPASVYMLLKPEDGFWWEY